MRALLLVVALSSVGCICRVPIPAPVAVQQSDHDDYEPPVSGDYYYLTRADCFPLHKLKSKEQQTLALPVDPIERKNVPIATGVLDYFPDALAEVARVSKIGNDQHNPGQPLHWDKSKSTDEADSLMRHLIQRGTRDTDGSLHSAKVAWRALALLQRELEGNKKS